MEKAEAETALAEVMPILEAAKLELQKLDKSDVTEIRYRWQSPAGLVPSIPPESSYGNRGWACSMVGTVITFLCR